MRTSDIIGVCFWVMLFSSFLTMADFFYDQQEAERQSREPQICTADSMAGVAPQTQCPPNSNNCQAKSLAQRFGAWRTLIDGSLEFEQSCLNYQRFTGIKLRECLRDKHIVFLADSLGRYQYLALAYWLEKLEPPPATSSNFPAETETLLPTVCAELSWGEFSNRWKKFFEGTSKLLGGNEQCDCFRMDSEKCCDHPRTVENRFYTLKEYNIKLTYIQLFGQNELHGHSFKDGELPCKAGHCDPNEIPLEWKGTLPEVLRTIVKPMRPTHLIVNTGMWWEPKLDNPTDMRWLEEVALAGNDALAPTNGVAMWRASTAERGGLFVHDHAAKRVMAKYGWMVFDTGVLTHLLATIDQELRDTRKKTEFWNKKHFHCAGYNEMNNYLANLICPSSAAA
jgi:hypothetical protein